MRKFKNNSFLNYGTQGLGMKANQEKMYFTRYNNMN